MSNKKYANFYTDSKFKNINHNLVKVKDDNNYLFASGKYNTKILEEDLPQYFVKLYLGAKYEFVSIKNIKDIINFVKSNQTFNTKDIEVELQKKKEWFNENVKHNRHHVWMNITHTY